MEDEGRTNPTAADLLYAIGVAVSSAGVADFRTRVLPASVSTRHALSHVWLGYAAFGEAGEWAFCRFARATKSPGCRNGSLLYSALVDVEDYAGFYAVPGLRHTVALLALDEKGPCVAFDSAQQGMAACDVLCGERREALEAALLKGNASEMRTVLSGIHLLTPFADGALMELSSMKCVGSVRIEIGMGADTGTHKGLHVLRVFPRKGF